MTRLNKTYNCKQHNFDNITIESLDDLYLAGDLIVSVVDEMVAEDSSQVALSRADALSLAWDIIEHFGEGTRPKPVIKVGDYVKGNLGIIGRVASISDEWRGTLVAKAPNGSFEWVISDCSPVTEQEFIDYYRQRIADIANRQD